MSELAASGGSDFDREWRRFVVLYLRIVAGGLLAIWLAALVIDPYDTGRFPTFMPAGIDDPRQHANIASGGRNPIFDAAIFGNSHGQLLDPNRLSGLTGMKFIQMTTPGSGPREQLTLIRYFFRHHESVRGIVLIFDQAWCTHDEKLPALYDLPFWLFSESNIEYITGMLNVRAIPASVRRVSMALGMSKPIDPAGYRDYEAGKTWNLRPPTEDTRPAANTAGTINADFPAIAALEQVLGELRPDLPIVAVLPPQFYLLLPVANSTEAREFALCKSELRRRIAARGNGGFMDDLVKSELSRNPENFMDLHHYRSNVARMLEDRIAATFNGVAEKR